MVVLEAQVRLLSSEFQMQSGSYDVSNIRGEVTNAPDLHEHVDL
jgi:hypothetical protein